MRRRIEFKLQKIRKKIAKSFAKAIYALPFFSRQDPRRRLTSIKVECQRSPAIPSPLKSLTTDWYVSIRSPEVIKRSAPLSLNADETTRFREGTKRYQNGNEYELPEVFLACLHKAKIYSKDFLVLTHANRILFDSALSNQEVIEANGICDKVFWPRIKQVKGSYCLLANPWASAYYHWIIDILPRLSLVESHQELDSVSYIVPESLHRFQRDSLELAGVSPDRLTHFDGGNWEVERLLFPALLSPPGNPSPHAVAWLRARFLSPDRQTAAAGRRLIYLTRRDAPQRRVLNEDDIAAYLLGRGFEIVCPGDLSFAEQIRIFSEASFVVAPHGAGLTNMVFAPPGTALVEFFGDNYINGCYWALANICQHHHAFLTGMSTGLDYRISLEDLKALLRRMGMS